MGQTMKTNSTVMKIAQTALFVCTLLRDLYVSAD